MRNIQNVAGALAILVGVCGLTVANATAIDTQGAWNEFRVPVAGGTATECTAGTCLSDIHGNFVFAPLPPWSFSGPAIFAVTDFGHLGDVSKSTVFNVFDNSIFLGSTSTPASGRSNCVARGLWDDPECNLLEGLFSHGAFTLGAGEHNITINSGVAAPGFFKALAIQVAEPNSLALFGFGFVILGMWTRPRRVR